MHDYLTWFSRGCFAHPAKVWFWSVVFFFLAAINIVSAQTFGKIAGTVTDRKGEPLPGANVFIEGTNMGAAADVDGVYYILNIPPGKYELRAVIVGYKPMKVVDVIVNGGRTTNINFEMQEEVLETDEVVVIAKRPEIERDKTSTSSIVRFDEVEQLPGIQDIGDVLNLTSDVVDGMDTSVAVVKVKSIIHYRVWAL
jgi:hypothetical protein